MNQRRDDLSTADLAGQQPAETEAPDTADELEPAGLADDDLARDEPAREDLPRDELTREDLPREDLPEEPAAEAEVDQGPGPVHVEAAAGDEAVPRTASAGSLLADDDAEGFRARWTDVQNGFVDSPRQAVEDADGLVASLMQHLATTFADERGRLERQWDRGDEVSTDDLRTAFQRYRSFFERLLAT
jgi:hypothetical protein